MSSPDEFYGYDYYADMENDIKSGKDMPKYIKPEFCCPECAAVSGKRWPYDYLHDVRDCDIECDEHGHIWRALETH